MKAIISIIYSGDEGRTVDELVKNHFYVTSLSATGGFLKSPTKAIVIATANDRVRDVVSIIKKTAGTRKITDLTDASLEAGSLCPGADIEVEVDAETGGCAILVMNLEEFEKF